MTQPKWTIEEEWEFWKDGYPCGCWLAGDPIFIQDHCTHEMPHEYITGFTADLDHIPVVEAQFRAIASRTFRNLFKDKRRIKKWKVFIVVQPLGAYASKVRVGT